MMPLELHYILRFSFHPMFDPRSGDVLVYLKKSGWPSISHEENFKLLVDTVVPGFSVLGFRALH